MVEKNTRGGSCRNWWLFSFSHSLWATIEFPEKLHRLCPHRDHIVLSHYSNSLTVSSYGLNHFDTTALGIYGIYKPMQSLIKPVHFALGFHEALLGLLNPVDKEVCCLNLQFRLEALNLWWSLFFMNNKVLYFCTLQTMCLPLSLPSHLPSFSLPSLKKKQ